MWNDECEHVKSDCDPAASSHEWRYELSGHDILYALRYCHICGKSYILIEDETAKEWPKERRRFVWVRIEEDVK